MRAHSPKASEHRWLVVQAASGLVFMVFLAAHLANTVAALLGPGWYDRIQGSLRAVYLALPAELLILGALAVHVAAGVRRMVLRRRSGIEPAMGLQSRLHRYSAVYLLVFVAGHVLATRGVGLAFEAPPRAAGLAFTLWWLPAWFYPYYGLLAASGLYHGVNGTLRALKVLGVRTSNISPARSGRFGLAMAAGATVLMAALLALGGVFYEIPDPRESVFARVLMERFSVGR